MNNIVDRCKEDYGYTEDDMIIIEKEFKRFMILSILADKEGPGMFSMDVDNLWHTFLLFTKEYANFCKQYAGTFIHHEPKPNMKTTPEKAEEVHLHFVSFLENYEKIFKEEIHSIWLLDMSSLDLS